MSARRRLNVSMYGRRDEGLRRPSVFAVGLTAAVAAVFCTPAVALAAGAGGGASMPWTRAPADIARQPVRAHGAHRGGLGFVIGGGIWAFSRSEEGPKRFGQIVIGLRSRSVQRTSDIVGVRWGGGLTCWSSMRSMHRCFGQCCSPELSRRWWWSRH